MEATVVHLLIVKPGEVLSKRQQICARAVCTRLSAVCPSQFNLNQGTITLRVSQENCERIAGQLLLLKARFEIQHSEGHHGEGFSVQGDAASLLGELYSALSTQTSGAALESPADPPEHLQVASP